MSEVTSKDEDNPVWTQRNIMDEPRLSELVELYESLGFEVMIKDFNPNESPDECTECMAASPEKFKILYTRRK